MLGDEMADSVFRLLWNKYVAGEIGTISFK